ncbi:MAG: hypothetical protein WC346_12740 [Methanogenium sp.]|jgi:uncharacterized protein (UPF0128 family)
MEKDKEIEKLVKAIGVLAEIVNDKIKADDALKYTQATLNAAHTIQVLNQVLRNTQYPTL